MGFMDSYNVELFQEAEDVVVLPPAPSPHKSLINARKTERAQKQLGLAH